MLANVNVPLGFDVHKSIEISSLKKTRTPIHRNLFFYYRRKVDYHQEKILNHF